MNNLNGTAARTYITGSTFGRSRFKENRCNLTKILQEFLKTTRGKHWDYFETAWTLQEDCSGSLEKLGNSGTCWGTLEDHLGTTCGLFACHLGTSTRSGLFGSLGLLLNSTSEQLCYYLRTTLDY